jgi:hypothetical protein
MIIMNVYSNLGDYETVVSVLHYLRPEISARWASKSSPHFPGEAVYRIEPPFLSERILTLRDTADLSNEDAVDVDANGGTGISRVPEINGRYAGTL